MHKITTISILLFFMNFAMLGCSSNENSLSKVTISLDWFPNANHAGIYIAQELGYFEDEGLEVDINIPQDPAAILATVATGRSDFGISYTFDLLEAREQGLQIVTFMSLVQEPLNSLLTLEGNGIKTPKDLHNKIIGYPGIPSHKSILVSMLQDSKVEMDEVIIENIGFSLTPALLTKRVDAVIGAFWTYETILIEQEGGGARPKTLYLQDWGIPKYHELILITNEKINNDSPNLIESFKKAVKKGYMKAIEDPELALNSLPDTTDLEIEKKSIELLIPLWNSHQPTFGYQDKQFWKGVVDWAVNNDIINSSLSVNEFILPQTK